MRIDEKQVHEAMNRRLSALDASPARRSTVWQRVAQEEAPIMKKKLSLGVVIALVLVSLTVLAVAAGIIFSPKVDAATAADRALNEKYGITPSMLAYFVRNAEEQADGSIQVTYRSNVKGALEYVLGEYQVTVRNGKAASVTWSKDGIDTAGGYEADAWGAPQLQEMLNWTEEHHSSAGYYDKAVAVAERNGVSDNPADGTAVDDNPEENVRISREGREKSKYSPEEMVELARKAVAKVYGMTAEQEEMLDWTQDYFPEEAEEYRIDKDFDHAYCMENGSYCYMLLLYLTQGTIPDPADPDSNRPFVEKDGGYWVWVNVENGTIERIDYDSGLSGNG